MTDTEERWPELPWRDWQPTMSTLHLWLQIVGKVRMALNPPLNHWWHITLYVTARGLTTSPIPIEGRDFEVTFDFIDHRLDVSDTEGRTFEMTLAAISVATFYREFMEGLRGLGIEVAIRTTPSEVDNPIPFESDEEHASYDRMHAHLFWRALLDADRVMKESQTGFIGKVSPVHLFWGSFDLATSRFSGQPAPRHPGGVPNAPDWVEEEAYSREESAIGWWPSSEPPGPAFYAYTYPAPEGISAATLRPAEAFWHDQLGEFILPNDAIRTAADPDAKVQEFFQSTYEAGAKLAGWDRASLEPAEMPERPPTRPWSI